MKVLMGGRNNGVGTSGSEASIISEVIVGITSTIVMELQHVVKNYNKGDGYVAKTDVK